MSNATSGFLFVCRKIGAAGIISLLMVGGCHSSPAQSTNLNQAKLIETMETVSDWQWQQFDASSNQFTGYDESAHMSPTSGDSHPQGWVYAAFYVGMARYARLAEESGNDEHLQRLKRIAKHSRYLFAPRIYNADDYAIGQLYLDLYEKYQDPAMITPLRVIFDQILNSPPTVDLRFERVTQKSQFTGELMADYFDGRGFSYAPCKNRWCWADALFMGPPVWFHLANVTGDERYRDFANQEFWETVDLLWDEEDHLFFRDTRFFDKREPNGEKVIWARGVGWVAAGLARILEQLPTDYPERPRYEAIFQKLMARLAGAQQPDGFWRPSVLAPETQPYKETSGTALIAFAFASGINQGVLNKDTYMPVALSAWQALTGAIQPDGKLGWVQQIAASPDSVDENDSQIYAVGAFLLTGTELYQLLEENKAGKRAHD
ncbi:glycoside hydrolase family 88/105 protein [Lacimicrobium alkaliphilum]|uniref:Glycosyl hydrolase family 88 n=1 Tax=Lacimicrobium alkaliphilum TaxID=1526571 RepID=A0ABQ1R6S9_9ALTE|nr:glycoside hydrolase family 88 protein [Lacimicrobium alkaliphilum]GGD60432.1 hypothetical protein GCM10011357_14610 [Lacimicrobium alkaliphilum]